MWQKLAASLVNIGIACAAVAPAMLVSFDAWRVSSVASFFGYNWIFRRRCIGSMVVGTASEPVTLRYVCLYTMGMSTCLFYWRYPCDLLMVNGAAQIVCLSLTGDTVHGRLSGIRTYRVARRRAHEMEEAEGRAREASKKASRLSRRRDAGPDCSRHEISVAELDWCVKDYQRREIELLAAVSPDSGHPAQAGTHGAEQKRAALGRRKEAMTRAETILIAGLLSAFCMRRYPHSLALQVAFVTAVGFSIVSWMMWVR